jgi:glutamate synthase domain-containing protein 1
MFEKLLKNNDVADALDAIWFMQERGFKVGEGRAKYTAYEAKLTAFRFINILLRS